MRTTMRLAVLLLLAAPLAAQVPPGTDWIWTSAPPAEPADHAWFAAEFTLEHAPAAAQLCVSADNHARIYLNGRPLARAEDWSAPLQLDVSHDLVAGRNLLAFAARNDGGAAALLAFVSADGATVFRTDDAVRAFTEEPPDWPAPAGGVP